MATRSFDFNPLMYINGCGCFTLFSVSVKKGLEEAKITLWHWNLVSPHLRTMSECLGSERKGWKSSSLFCFISSSAAVPPRLDSLPGMVIVATRFNRHVDPDVKNPDTPHDKQKNPDRRISVPPLVGPAPLLDLHISDRKDDDHAME